MTIKLSFTSVFILCLPLCFPALGKYVDKSERREKTDDVYAWVGDVTPSKKWTNCDKDKICRDHTAKSLWNVYTNTAENQWEPKQWTLNHGEALVETGKTVVIDAYSDMDSCKKYCGHGGQEEMTNDFYWTPQTGGSSGECTSDSQCKNGYFCSTQHICEYDNNNIVSPPDTCTPTCYVDGSCPPGCVYGN